MHSVIGSLWAFKLCLRAVFRQELESRNLHSQILKQNCEEVLHTFSLAWWKTLAELYSFSPQQTIMHLQYSHHSLKTICSTAQLSLIRYRWMYKRFFHQSYVSLKTKINRYLCFCSRAHKTDVDRSFWKAKEPCVYKSVILITPNLNVEAQL